MYAFNGKHATPTIFLLNIKYLKSTEDMIFALTGQFKQLSLEPEKFR